MFEDADANASARIILLAMETVADILIIEDDPSINEVVCAHLERRGYRCRQAFSGTEGLLLLRERRPDVVITDLMLPGVPGEEIVRAIRGADSALPIIVISARITAADKISLLQAGADDYLGKPFDSRELLARVRANLRRQAPIEELVVLRYGDLVYDTKALLLACGREEIAVSKKLGLMIELFMKSKGQALARATLFARVWGADADVEEAILDNYIGFFRRRLAQIHSKMSLRTVRGVGYALVEEKEGR